MEQKQTPDQREEQREQLRELFLQALDLHTESHLHLMEHNLIGYDAARADLYVVRMKFDRLVSSL